MDVVSFTGGIGEHSATVRQQVLHRLDFLGVEIDEALNREVRGEGSLHAEGSQVHLYVVRTDEELVVARQTFEFLESGGTTAQLS